METHLLVLKKIVSLVALIGLVVSFAFISSTQISKAATSSYHHLTQPLCTGSTWASPDSQDIHAHQQAVVTVYWTCQGIAHVIANIDWGDGHTDSYTCWVNCNTNSNKTRFTHTYNETGEFGVKIWMSSYGSGSTGVTVYVS